MIYLDNAATTKDITIPYTGIAIKSDWEGNPHSIHKSGRQAQTRLNVATDLIKSYINGHDGEFFWTGSGSEANSLAIETVCESSTLLTTAIEHKSILQHKQCFAYQIVTPNGYGWIHPNFIEKALANGIDLVSVQFINNETGAINPIKEITEIAHKRNAYMHTDAVQAFGKYKIDVEDLGVDLLTISAHKVHGPKGLGGLWVRNNVLKDDERGLFPYLGTPPVELVDRLAFALESMLITKNTQRVQELENTFLSQFLGHRIEHYFIVRPQDRLPGLISLYIPGVNADELVLNLSDEGVMISSGSACDNGKVEPSHVLTAMGILPQKANETIRISISSLNEHAEMKEAANTMANVIERMKNG